MKKLFIILMFCAIGMVAHAQKGAAIKLPLTVGDTIVNTGTSSKIISFTGGYSGASIQVVLKKISGTGAGTVQLQGSNDGANYVNLGTAYTITDVATQSQVFYVTNPLPTKIKVLCTGSGTESVQVSVWYRNPIYQVQ